MQHQENIGYLEVFNESVIRGWTIDAMDECPAVELMVGEDKHLLSTLWEKRSDVAEKYGDAYIDTGFLCQLSNEVRHELVQAYKNREEIKVLSAGIELQGESFSLTDPSLLSVLDDSFHQTSEGYQKLEIESIENFSIRGWVLSHENLPISPSEIKIFQNGSEVRSAVTCFPHGGVSEEFNLPNLEFGFEILLPGYIWEVQQENNQSDQECLLEIKIGSKAATADPLSISRQQAQRWLVKLAETDESHLDNWQIVLAIEHIRYGGFAEMLPPRTLRFFKDYVQRLSLESFLNFDSQNSLLVGSSAEVSESTSTLLLWEAMHALNALLASEKGARDVCKAVLETLKRFQLRGEAREWYLFLSVQLTCESYDFRKFASEVDLSHFKKYADIDKAHKPEQMALALPLLVVEKRVEWATSTIKKISNRIYDGWLYTECVRFASKEVNTLYFSGDIKVDELERYHNAIFQLLEAFKAEWFSRLHDAYLVDTVVSILLNLDAYRDAHRNTVITKALSIYGLCPDFWQKLSAQKITERDQNLLCASENFGKIQSYFDNQRGASQEEIFDVVTSLEYFNGTQNSEALICLREICLNQLQVFNDSASFASQQALNTLMKLDNSSAIRVCAFPLTNQNRLQSDSHLTQAETLERIVREKINPKNTSRSICLNLSKDIDRIRELANSEGGASSLIDIYCNRLEKSVVAINSWEENFLGFDTLANIFSILLPLRGEQTPLLMNIQKTLERVIDKIENPREFPTPVQSGLTLLIKLNKAHKLKILPILLREIEFALRSKFGNEFTLQRIAHSNARSSVQQGWPSDTLVAIFCSKDKVNEVSTRFGSAWLKELDRRQISYLFVTGEGNNTVEDKQLSLSNINDGYEDQVFKTVRFFEWFYHNTDYEYVVKLDSNTYIDVCEYFDTLTYRKYPYYGYRIEAKSFDRTAHQDKCTTQSGDQKRLDLSPPSSIYASGELGYSLSRQAIADLLKESKTYDGQLIVRTSYRADKAVGDLLAKAAIQLSNENLVCFEYRKNSKDAIPVAMGNNTFFPGRRSPIQTAYIEGHASEVIKFQKEQPDELWPKKIWPTCWSANVSADSNQLELLTDAKLSFELIQSSSVITISVVRNEMEVLERWLEHYRGIGIQCFIIVDNCSDDGTREFLISQPDVVLYSSDTQYKYSHYGVAWQQAILGNLCLGKWVIMADADEFLVYEGCETRSVSDLVQSMEDECANGALIYMIDMYPYDDLADASFNESDPFDAAPYFDRNSLIELKFGGGMYSNSRNFVNGFRHRIAPSRINAYVSQKYALFKYYPWLRFSEGLHYAANMSLSDQPIFFAHFKYHRGFKEKILTEIRRKQHFNGAEEYKRYASILKESKGGFGSEKYSTHYKDSSSYVNLVERIHN